MKKYIALFLMVFAGAAVLYGCSSSSSSYTTTTATSSAPTTTAAGSPASVSIASEAFNPSSLVVAAGTTVTWTNNDPIGHTVTSTAGPVNFGSGTLGTGSTFSFTFTQVGTYEYHCSIHTYMTGTITVQ